MKWTKRAAFINREEELKFLKGWVGEQPESILFLFGPKSSGKTTLLNRFLKEIQTAGSWEIKHLNLREILVANYKDFLASFICRFTLSSFRAWSPSFWLP